jgi:hypothetical protein
MGQSYKVAWAEIWDEVKDVFTNARLTGQATMKDDDCLFMKRSGFLEETYFSWSIIPMVGEDGTVMGLYNPAFEKVLFVLLLSFAFVSEALLAIFTLRSFSRFLFFLRNRSSDGTATCIECSS